jgi:spermidine synthase
MLDASNPQTGKQESTGLLKFVSLLLFCSGFCGLAYQTAWFRELRLIFGASTPATGAVLAIFMGGLGIGGVVLGKRADKSPNPLRFYGILEVLIGVFAAISPLLVAFAQLVYGALGGSVSIGFIPATVARILLSVLVLGAPTFLMGGTLPAAARAVETPNDLRRSSLAVIYGINTLGALSGVLLSTLLLLEVLGIKRLLWSCALLNILIGFVAIRISFALKPALALSSVEALSPKTVNQHFVYVCALVVGFVFFLMELVWYRLLGPLLGGSVYTFGLILATALFGIGLGGAAYSIFGQSRRPTALGFATTCALEALFLAIPFAVGDYGAVFAALIQPFSALGFYGLVFGWSLITVFYVFVPSFIAGYQFPLLVGLLGAGSAEVGKETGLAYGFNTLGAILGSLAGGFGLLQALTAQGSYRLSVSLLSAMVIVTVVIYGRNKALSLAPLAASVLACVLLLAEGPTSAFRHSAIGVGRVNLAGMSYNQILGFLSERKRVVVQEFEGRESSVGITNEDGYAIVINGKSDGQCRADVGTQVMGGLLGCALHEAPKNALVIGLGTGESAGWLKDWQSIESVDVVELEPSVVEASKYCSVANRGVLEDPKVHIFIADAREVLTTFKKKYDIIFSEPSNPYRAGVASLFTTDFYRSASNRLADRGLFLQWLQTYRVDADTLKTVYKSLKEVFPYIETYYTQAGDLLLVCSMHEIQYDYEALDRRTRTEPLRTGMKIAWRVEGVEGLLSHFVGGTALADALAKSAPDINTDDRTVIEFSFARSTGVRSDVDLQELRALAKALRADLPHFRAGTPSIEAIKEYRVQTGLAVDNEPILDQDNDEGLKARAQAYIAFLRSDLEGVLEWWNRQSVPPSGLASLSVVGEALAEKGDEQAPLLAEQIDKTFDVEAEVVKARFYFRKGMIEDATRALVKAFSLYRQNPWALHPMMKRALDLAVEVAGRDKNAGKTLFDSLSSEFAVGLLSETRNLARYKIALITDFEKLCVEALKPYEENPIWDVRFLEERVRCYKANNHPLLEQATKDFEKAERNAPRRLIPQR